MTENLCNSSKQLSSGIWGLPYFFTFFLPLALNAYRSTQSPSVSTNRGWKNSPSVSATSPQLTNRKKKVLFSRKMLLS